MGTVSVLSGDDPNFLIRRPKRKRLHVSSLARPNCIYSAVFIEEIQGIIWKIIYGHGKIRGICFELLNLKLPPTSLLFKCCQNSCWRSPPLPIGKSQGEM